MDKLIRNDETPTHHPFDDSVAMHIAFPEPENPGLKKLAFCLALYIGLALLWMPGFNFSEPVYTLDQETSQTHRRKVLRPPPEKPLTKVKTRKQKARKVPMPDTTPDDPEPIVAFSNIAVPEPEIYDTDNWEFGVPDGVPAAHEKVAVVGEAGVVAPIFLKKVTPRYPIAGVQVRLQGYVILQAILRKTGIVDNVQVLRGLGRGKFGFEEEAIASLKQWTFLPGKVNGEPADVRMNLRVDFIIN
ncbi:MAG: TonB family protein [Acidobacteriota bacterium]|nr:TonB family protein [Acidobacteriota bacterium]